MAPASERLTALIESADREGILQFFDQMTEPARRSLAPTAAKLHRELWALRIAPGRPAAEQRSIWEQYQTAALAVLATGTLAEIQKLGVTGVAGFGLVEIFSDRRPAWLPVWVSWSLAGHGWAWRQIRALVAAGVCARPEHDPNYYLRMLDQGQQGAASLLRSDPDLLQHEVWRLFEVEGRPDASLATTDRYRPTERGWSHAFLELSAEGLLYRQRLLQQSVAALQRGFPQFQAGWFSRFHEALEPTLEERAALVREYLHLLASPIPPTVSFALKALTTLDGAGLLDSRQFLHYVIPALHSREKSTAELILRLLQRAVARVPELAEESAAYAEVLLQHPVAAMQAKALRFVRDHSSPERLGARLSAAAAVVAPSLRGGLPVAPAPTDTLPVEALDVSRRWLELAGVHEDGSLGPLDLQAEGVPRLHDGNRLIPVASFEELIDLFLRLLEQQGPPDELERLLDGVARFASARATADQRMLSPIRKRAGQLVQKSKRLPTVANLLAALARTWLWSEEWSITVDGNSIPSLLTERAKALALRAAAGVDHLLLSTPTHANGWIEGATYAERVSADAADLQCARLRTGHSAGFALSRNCLWDPHYVRWAASLFSVDRAPWFRLGAAALAQNLDWWEANWQHRVYLEALFEADSPLGEEGLDLLCLGLACKENGEGTLATDALIEAVGDGRVEPADLCAALARLMMREGLKPKRIALRLEQTSRASALHGLTVLDALRPLRELTPMRPFRQLVADLEASSAGASLPQQHLRARLQRARLWSQRTSVVPAATHLTAAHHG